MGRAKVDISNQRFGRLIAVSDSGRRSTRGDVYWLCQCDCGLSTEVVLGNLRSGNVTSCGCFSKEQSSKRAKARKRPPKLCCVESCENTIEKGGNGYCGMHAQRVRRYGDPDYLTPEEVRRANSRSAQLARVTDVKPTTYRKLFGRHEHRVIGEMIAGRKLRSDEHVHHKDENKHNNSPENLEVMSRLEHLQLHASKKKSNAA